MTDLLSIAGLRKAYAGVQALAGVDLAVPAGSITGLIGPNGSGKSTLFDCVTGAQAADAGTVLFDREPVHGRPTAALARLGLRRTFQRLRVFPTLSVRENLLAAAQAGQGSSLVSDLLRGGRARRAEADAAERAERLLAQTGLAEQVAKPAGSLSYGQKKLVEMAMVMMGAPRLVLLDEPMAGVNPSLIERLKEHIGRWRQEGVTFLIIEHNLKLVFEICDVVHVLDQGRLLTAGPPAAVANDPRVIDAYLGGRGAELREREHARD